MIYRYALVFAAAAFCLAGRVSGSDNLLGDIAPSEHHVVADLAAFGGETSDECGCSTCCSCCPDPWVVSREPLFCHSYLDCLTELGSKIDNGCNFKMPITGGAWH